MLRLRIRYLLNSKGIVRPYNYLIKIGFSPNVATRILNGKLEQIKLSQLKLLCKILDLTPNDLLEFVPLPDESLPEGHQLLSLMRNDKPFNIIGHINKLSFDKIKEVEEFISKMENGKGQEH